MALNQAGPHVAKDVFAGVGAERSAATTVAAWCSLRRTGAPVRCPLTAARSRAGAQRDVALARACWAVDLVGHTATCYNERTKNRDKKRASPRRPCAAAVKDARHRPCRSQSPFSGGSSSCARPWTSPRSSWRRRWAVPATPSARSNVAPAARRATWPSAWPRRCRWRRSSGRRSCAWRAPRSRGCRHPLPGGGGQRSAGCSGWQPDGQGAPAPGR